MERLHRTLLDEHFRIQGRKTWYESLEAMQTDPDAYLHHHNHERTHQGRNMNGRTPYQAFLDGSSQEQPEGERATRKLPDRLPTGHLGVR